MKTPPVERLLFQRGNAQIEVFAQGTGLRVVMIPSLGRGAGDFEDLASRVAAAGFRALRPQPRGLGASTGALQNITLHDLAADVAEVVRQDGGDAFVIAGHAFGNFVARTAAADYPARVKAVVLLAATHVWPLAPDIRDSINKSHQMSLPDAVRLRHLQHVFFAPGNDASVWLGGWDEDVMPVDDLMTPPESSTCYRDEWGADRVTIVRIPNASHALLPEQPAAVADAVIGYLRKLKA
jgi:pimeloyl-ACP methyl ester carboxylesterase